MLFLRQWLVVFLSKFFSWQKAKICSFHQICWYLFRYVLLLTLSYVLYSHSFIFFALYSETCHAILAGNAGTELTCINNLEEITNTNDLPILPHLLFKYVFLSNYGLYLIDWFFLTQHDVSTPSTLIFCHLLNNVSTGQYCHLISPYQPSYRFASYLTMQNHLSSFWHC